jgi:hypothetical protein
MNWWFNKYFINDLAKHSTVLLNNVKPVLLTKCFSPNYYYLCIWCTSPDKTVADLQISGSTTIHQNLKLSKCFETKTLAKRLIKAYYKNSILRNKLKLWDF